MRIVIDLQAAQTENRFRGIGRCAFNFTEALIRNRGTHEIILALSGLFPESVKDLRLHFSDWLSEEEIRVWYTPIYPNQVIDSWQTTSAQMVREAFLQSLNPDVILIFSLFEAFPAVTSIGCFDSTTPVAVLLHDLIPLFFQEHYFADLNFKHWYTHKLSFLEKSTLILATSESVAQEPSKANVPLANTTIASTSLSVDARFQKTTYDPIAVRTQLSHYQIQKPFLMYTGGIEYRKNIEGLIRSYALIDPIIRSEHQLVIVCSIQPEIKTSLLQLASTCGLIQNELILTGFVSDTDLVLFYNQCKAFVFPSWHEGFGLPVLEAMRCGAAVIAAHTSSLPELVADPDALFDPYDDQAIATHIHKVLTDEEFRQNRIQHGLRQAQSFSWDKSAKKALQALEALKRPSPPPRQKRLKLAFVSPMPPEKTGVAQCSAMLLRALAEHYDIDVIVSEPLTYYSTDADAYTLRQSDWFVDHANQYDRVVYQLRNSPFHAYQVSLLQAIPGITVLHDFYLGHLLAYLEEHHAHNTHWSTALYEAHGYNAVLERQNNRHDLREIIHKYPCNQGIIQNSLGMISHSQTSIQLAKDWLSAGLTIPWFSIPLVNIASQLPDKQTARSRLKIPENSFVVCSFGYIGATKLNLELFEAWAQSSLAHQNSMLIFVGKANDDAYLNSLNALIHQKGYDSRALITGWVSNDDFSAYLAAADLGVQLRSDSQGESSATVLDCMSHHLPVIINAHGSFKELPKTCVWMLPDLFTLKDLTHALDALSSQTDLRNKMKTEAYRYVVEHHSPQSCALAYVQAIETIYSTPYYASQKLIHELSDLPKKPDKGELLALANCITQNHFNQRVKHLWIDITHWYQNGIPENEEADLVRYLLEAVPPGLRVEPIYTFPNSTEYRYARALILDWLCCPNLPLDDHIVAFDSGDHFITFTHKQNHIAKQSSRLQQLRQQGLVMILLHYETNDELEFKLLENHSLSLWDRVVNGSVLLLEQNITSIYQEIPPSQKL